MGSQLIVYRMEPNRNQSNNKLSFCRDSSRYDKINDSLPMSYETAFTDSTAFRTSYDHRFVLFSSLFLLVSDLV